MHGGAQQGPARPLQGENRLPATATRGGTPARDNWQGCLLASPSSLQGRHRPRTTHNGPSLGPLLTRKPPVLSTLAAPGPSSGHDPPPVLEQHSHPSAQTGKQNVLSPRKGELLSLKKQGNYASCYTVGPRRVRSMK